MANRYVAAIAVAILGLLTTWWAWPQGVYICQGANCPPSLNGITLSNNIFNSGAATGTAIGNLAVLTAGLPFSGSFNPPGGPNGASFQIINGNQLATNGLVAATGSTQAYSITITATQANSVNGSVTVPFTVTAQQVPTGITYNPASPVSVLDNITTSTTISAVTVTTSDGHAWFGTTTLTANAGGRVVLSGNNIVPAHNFTSADDGSNLTVTVQAAENGTTVAVNLSLNVTSSGSFPLTISANGRYFQTAGGQPFLMMAATIYNLVGMPYANSGVTGDSCNGCSMDTYFSSLVAHGFNTVNFDLFCSVYEGCPAAGTDFVGNAPFTGTLSGCSGTTPSCYDLATPNTTTYWTRVDNIIKKANTYGLLVIPYVVDTAGCQTSPADFWVTVTNNFNSGGLSKLTAFGNFVGTRYANRSTYPNIEWIIGEDFVCFTGGNNDQMAATIIQGVQATEGTPARYVTSQLDFPSGGNGQGTQYLSTDDTGPLRSLITFNGSYQYRQTYYEVLRGYNAAAMPVYLVEENYDGDNDNGLELNDPGCDISSRTSTCVYRSVLRKQLYWTMAAGGMGQFWSNYIQGTCGLGTTTNFCGGLAWQNFLDTPAQREVHNAQQFFTSIQWQNLAPAPALVTAQSSTNTISNNTCPAGNGNGGCIGGNSFALASYANSAQGSTAVVYVPGSGPSSSTVGSVTIDMTQFGGNVTGQWFDPTAAYSAGTNPSAISGSPFSNTGTHQFTPTGVNSAGSGNTDWVLLLSAAQKTVCPFTGGATASDGCVNAPAGTPQFTAAGVLSGSDLSGQTGKNLLTGNIYPHLNPYCSGRTSGTSYGFVNIQNPNSGGATPSSTPCPNWNVPGVDYYVGCWLTVCPGATGAPNGGGGLVTGKDPSNSANWPTGCCSFSGTTLTVSGSNVTLSGFDYCNYPTGNGGIAVRVTGNNVTLTNSYWCQTPANFGRGLNINAWVFATGSNFTVSYNTYDGGCNPGPAGTTLPCNSTLNNGANSWWLDVEPTATTSTWLMQYNFCQNTATACFASNSAFTSNPSITFNYNVTWNWGLNTVGPPPNHEDDIHICGNGTLNNGLHSFNTKFPMSYHTALTIDSIFGAGNSPGVSYIDGWFDLNCSAFTALNVAVDHDVIIDPGVKPGSQSGTNVGAAVEPVYFSTHGTGSTGDFRASYVDWSGGLSPFNITNFTMSMSANDYGLLSGGICDPRLSAGGSACQ